MAQWQYRLRIAVPEKTELIDVAWCGAFASEIATRVGAEKMLRELGRFLACDTDDGKHYIIPTDKILWIRVETRER